MSHSYFIHSSTDKHLGCFHILVIINNAVMNIGFLCSLKLVLWIPLGIIQKWYCWVSQKANPFLIFEVSPSVFHSKCINLHSHPHSKGFLFLHILTSTCCLSIDDRHSEKCAMISQCDFNLHFSDDY